MAFFEGTIYSETLHMDTQLGVILPQDSRPHHTGELMPGLTPREDPKVLILLHGLTDSASVWWRRTSIERYAELYDIAVIMPEVYKSYYQNMVYGEDYFTYISEEVPKLCQTLFGLNTDPDHLMIGGLSMGGYGALRCAFTYPERYCACASLSAGCDVKNVKNRGAVKAGPAKGFEKTVPAIFGENVEIPDECDIYWLADHLKDHEKKLRLYMTCGRQDGLYAANQRLKEQLEHCDLEEFVYEDWDGIHEWGYWDVAIQRFLAAFVK